MVSMNPIKKFVLAKTRMTCFKTTLCCILTLLVIGQTGCFAPAVGPGYSRLPILYGILVEDRSSGFSEYQIATAPKWKQIQVTRRGVGLDVTPNMTLETGDTIRTGSGVAVAIRFPNGSQLYVRSNSRIRIGSVFAFVGELFVRVKGAFRVDTEFVTAGAEGTEWMMRVSPNGDTRCVVLEGRTRMASNEQRWRSISVRANDQMITNGADYQRVTSAPPEEIRQIKRWVSQIDRLTQEPQTIDNDPAPPFFFHFKQKTYPEKKGDYPDRNHRERRPYPRPREDIVR
jgi:hypothetical protein